MVVYGFVVWYLREILLVWCDDGYLWCSVVDIFVMIMMLGRNYYG